MALAHGRMSLTDSSHKYVVCRTHANTWCEIKHFCSFSSDIKLQILATNEKIKSLKFACAAVTFKLQKGVIKADIGGGHWVKCTANIKDKEGAMNTYGVTQMNFVFKYGWIAVRDDRKRR